MSVTENEAARQVNTANLAQWSAVPTADDWQRAWEAMAEEPAAAFTAAQARADEHGCYLALRAQEENEHLIACDRCEAVVPEEETVGGDYCERYCLHCADTEQGERWTPEEFFEEGGEL